MRKYSELVKFPSFDERFNYLALHGVVGKETFGFERYFNQKFYRSREWQRIRNFVITRDLGYDLGVDGCFIRGNVTIHHMNPISIDDITYHNDILFNPEYLISVSDETHKQIHYGRIIRSDWVERSPNDTSPWRLT